MKQYFNIIKKVAGTCLVCASLLMGTSCVDDLNQTPHIGVTSEAIYSSVEGYRSVLAKIYASYSLVGQEKGGGQDLSSNSGYDLLRCLFHLQEGPTDECAYRWMSGDNLYSIAYMQWDATEPNISDVYYRLYYSIAVVNEFLRHTDEASLARFSPEEQAEIRCFAAEARFMRALDYWFVLDLFGKGPYVDVHTPTTAYTPEAYDSQALFSFIERELKDIENSLPETSAYGRANRAAVWALASRLYLNGEVYTGKNYATECITYSNKLIAPRIYFLEDDFSKLFNADNH